MGRITMRNVLCFLSLLHWSSGIQNTVVWSTRKGYRLEGSVFHSIELSSSLECGHHCVINQRCMSVNYRSGQIKPMVTALCEMNYVTSKEDNHMLKKDSTFTYYEPIKKNLPNRQPLPNPRKPQSNTLPSSNATTHSPSYPTPLHIATELRCPDLLSQNFSSGLYQIFNQSNSIYCHVNSTLQRAWTLVLSSTYQNWISLGYRRAFWEDLPVNNTTPNFNVYRMSLAQMEGVRNQSTMWRAVCNYDWVMGDWLDTARGLFAVFDPFDQTFTEGCKEVEYLNVRGNDCRECTALWYQDSNMLLHVDSGRASNCSFAAQTDSTPSEDNFGFYAHVNKEFECTKYDNATTSWWFG